MKLADVQVGHELEAVVFEANADRMRLMSALMRDPNPIHFDASSVEALGLGSRTINQGPATLSYLINVLAEWAGGTAAIRSFTARLSGNVFAGDLVECHARVTEMDPETGTITLTVEARVDGTVVAGGVAVVAEGAK
jgi:acyl dehydratase